MIAKIVMLYLQVFNTGTGDLLYETHMKMPSFSVSGNRMEDCRIEGVRMAEALTAKYKNRGYEHASTNVKCWWEEDGEDL
jgi:hypothetical protein